MFKESWNAKELIYQLCRRDFLMMYRKSFLGLGWVIFASIMGIVSLVFMNSAGVLSPGNMLIPYPAFVLVSTTIWGLFTKSTLSSSKTLNVGKSFIQQINFLHYSLLFKQLMQELTNFIISFIVIIVVLLIFGVQIHYSFFLFPVLILPMLFLRSAIGIIISVVSSVTMDIDKILNFVLSILMLVTPVIYTAENVKGSMAKALINYNPLTYIFGSMRDFMLLGYMNDVRTKIILSVASFLFFVVALRWFYVSEEKVIEKMV
jgi:lipopolysaccharide transport system permease protein